MHLSSVDLNLLVVLHALLETESVKQAATRVALSPSATSHALARLRELIGDPLLVRSGRRLVPTPRALALKGRLSHWIGDAERLFDDDGPFDPSGSERRFALGTSDYVEYVLFVPLAARVAIDAPRVDLRSCRISEPADALRGGSLDLMIGPSQTWPKGIEQVPLYEERYVCLMRPGHPAVGELLTPARYAELSHVLITPHEGTAVSPLDTQLQALGLSRRIACTVATFAMGPRIVRETDHVLLMAERMARPMAHELGLRVTQPPFDIQFLITMAWHRRMTTDPAHRWLRGAVETCCR